MYARRESHSQSDVEAAIEKAVVFLPKNFVPRHTHSRRCYNMLKHILYESEYTVIEAKQSLLKSLSPSRIVATDQRVILVQPSFWSLWTGHNISSPTRYESIPYSNIANITLYTGMYFSTLYIHLNTGEGEEFVDGLKMGDAKAMCVFLEKTTEYLRRHAMQESQAEPVQAHKLAVSYLDMREAVRRIAKGSKLIWLGAEGREYVAGLIGVDRTSIVRMSSDELVRAAFASPERFNDCILLCYTDNYSARTARFLRQTVGIEAHVLIGGIEHYEQKVPSAYDAEEVARAKAWR